MRRPTGVTILAVIYMGAAAFTLFQAKATPWDKGWEYRIPGRAPRIYEVPHAAVYIVTGFTCFLIGAGLWRLRRWARVALIGLMIYGIAYEAAMLIWRSPGSVLGNLPLWGAVLIFIYYFGVIYYLLSADVKHAFGIQ